MGCSPEQPEFTDEVNKKVYVCKAFIDSLWEAPNDTKFDECGFRPIWEDNYKDRELNPVIPSKVRRHRGYEAALIC